MKTQTAQLRWMIRKDMPQVMTIENGGPGSSIQEEEILGMLRNKCTIGMVAELGDEVQGYLVYSLESDTLRIERFRVGEPYRRNGIGRLMAEKMASKLEAQRRTMIEIDLSERDIDSQLFFRAMGFKAVQVIHGSYLNGDAAYRFRLSLNEGCD